MRADSGIENLKGMHGKAVGVDTGSTGDIWATQHQAEYKLSDIRRYEGLAPAMLDLAAGRGQVGHPVGGMEQRRDVRFRDVGSFG